MSIVDLRPRASDAAPSRAAATAAYVVLFWSVAAALVAVAHLRLDRGSPTVALLAGIAAVVLSACGYMRLCARNATAVHALGVGIVWLVLAIAVEVGVTAGGGQRWFVLLGSPARPALRNLLLFAWIFAPVLFARGSGGAP
ncbi:MAG: hypothetical protein JWO56_287 [Acidobacteria bacterium]|nr:hypothetical protein [Acidobacteriota bacterium]